MSFFKKVMITFLIMVTTLGAGGMFYYKHITSPVSSEANKVTKTIVIPRGSSTKKIAEILQNNGMIRNKLVFDYASRDGRGSKMKAGEYELNTSMTYDEIIDKLVEGGKQKTTKRFTIPEGFETRQIAEKLSADGFGDKAEFEKLINSPSEFIEKYEFISQIPESANLEGYLFPDTYEVFEEATEKEVLEKMLSKFESVYKEYIVNGIEDTGLDLNKLMTMASIVEREAKLDEERDEVSAVFYNRIKKNMKLQSCATVQFALGERKQRLTYDDLEIKSPYNTYLNEGLPPYPIASPGLNSIKAALNPADVDYLYFVLNEKKGDGSHVFTSDYNKFINAKKSVRE